MLTFTLLCLFIHFQDQVIDEELELLVLASDGLWDVVPNDVSSRLSSSSFPSSFPYFV